jgi:hypothetical protein
MWSLKLKSGTKDEVYCYKARFVAKGCCQRASLDYTEIEIETEIVYSMYRVKPAAIFGPPNSAKKGTYKRWS